jgi:hypothetical protein
MGKTGKNTNILLLIAILVFGIFLAGCPNPAEEEVVIKGPEDKTKQVYISKSPASISLTLAEWQAADTDKKTLKVELSNTDGEATYKWYFKNGPKGETTLIEDATGASYMPEISANGNYYYYVVVTVTITEDDETTTLELTSNTALIRITDNSTPPETQFTIGSDRVHYVRGVGGTGSFMFRTGGNADASPDADVKYIDLLMGEMGCNILRIMVQDDYLNYINNDVQSRNSSVFYHDARGNFFAVIRRVNEYGGYVFANPWTAPPQFKTVNQINGGILKTTAYIDYADWLQNFLKWLNDNKAPIFAIGILNEPDYGSTAAYEGMGMSAEQHRDWFKAVGHFTTDYGVIPGYGGGGKTHHVLVMTSDFMGNPSSYDAILNDPDANQNFEILGRHWYASAARITKLAGAAGTKWADRPTGAGGYEGRYETVSLAQSPQMFAPGSTTGNIKREIWQTEHDFNYNGNEGGSTTIPGTNPQRTWSSAFAAMNDVDWGMRVIHESVFDWWFSSSYSGLVTSYQGTPVNGNGTDSKPGAIPWPAYTYTPRGRAYAHYARYINETWSLPVTQTKEKTGTNMKFNQTTSSFNAGAVDPKINVFEDVNGKFISIVMFTPNASTATTNTNNATSSTSIPNGFGNGGTNGTNDPTRASANVGRVEVVLPDGFTPTSASALRSYGWENADGKEWDDVPTGAPRYWINEPVFLYTTTEGKPAVEVNLPGGNIISIMVKGTWPGREVATPERVRPYTVN